jgi:TIR domain-containing protein
VSAPTAFLSHSFENSQVAKRLATDLRSKGVDVWFAEWEIRPGDSLRRKIDEGIEKASLFLVLLTPASIQSEWVQVELDAGMVKRIQGQCRLIPILLEITDEQVPPTLRGISWVRLDNYQDGLRRLIEASHNIETKPPLGPTPTYSTQQGSIQLPESAFPPDLPDAGAYARWAWEMPMASRDGQLVGVVANLGHHAERFDTKEKLFLAQVLPKYLDVRGFKSPFVDEGYVQFEFLPAQDGRRIWLQAEHEGVLSIEVWRSWERVPWDWILAEAYSGLVCLQDDRILRLFQSGGVVQAALTLGNLVGRGGIITDARVTTRGLRIDLMAPEQEVLAQFPRNPSVQYECEVGMNVDPWGCAKAFVKRALTKTGVLLFEDRLEAVEKNKFLNQYFVTPGEFRRPPASGV